MLTKSIRDSGVCRALIHYPKGKLENVSVLLKELERLPMMENLDLASEVTTTKWQLKQNKKINQTL